MTTTQPTPATTTPSLRITKLSGVWWIIGMPAPPLAIDPDYPEFVGSELGPYLTKKEAEIDMRGLKRFFANEPTAA